MLTPWLVAGLLWTCYKWLNGLVLVNFQPSRSQSIPAYDLGLAVLLQGKAAKFFSWLMLVALMDNRLNTNTSYPAADERRHFLSADRLVFENGLALFYYVVQDIVDCVDSAHA